MTQINFGTSCHLPTYFLKVSLKRTSFPIPVDKNKNSSISSRDVGVSYFHLIHPHFQFNPGSSPPTGVKSENCVSRYPSQVISLTGIRGRKIEKYSPDNRAKSRLMEDKKGRPRIKMDSQRRIMIMREREDKSAGESEFFFFKLDGCTLKSFAEIYIWVRFRTVFFFQKNVFYCAEREHLVPEKFITLEGDVLELRDKNEKEPSLFSGLDSKTTIGQSQKLICDVKRRRVFTFIDRKMYCLVKNFTKLRNLKGIIIIIRRSVNLHGKFL